MTTQQTDALQCAADLEAQLEAIGAGGVSGPLIGQPQAMPDLSQLTERGAKAWAGVDAQGLREGFTAADMATVSAQGFRDGVASLSANAVEPRNAIDRDALIDAIAQGLRGTYHCTRVWEAWHVGTMSKDDFEPVDGSETPTEIADAVLALLAAAPAQPAAPQGVAEVNWWEADGDKYDASISPMQPAQGVAYADATYALRASHGQAPAGATKPTEQQILEAAFAPAQPAVEVSRFGSPELQAMIIARCVEKDQADNKKKDPL